jgi:hypothetical protein
MEKAGFKNCLSNQLITININYINWLFRPFYRLKPINFKLNESNCRLLLELQVKVLSA